MLRKTREWLEEWQLTDKIRELPSKEIIKDLEKYKPLKCVNLFRGINDRKDLQQERKKKLRSFTYSEGLARVIACGDLDVDDISKCKGVIIKKKICPKKILIDFNRLDEENIDEVIVLR